MAPAMNIILPAAGKGTRLGLPYPKELHRVIEGRSLIDFSLSHILEGGTLAGRVSLTIIPEKQIVVEYVRSRLPGLQVRSSFFDDRFTEWPGSILSAQEHFWSRNIALLPDSSITLADGSPRLLEGFAASFDDGADIVFAYMPVDGTTNISALGALSVDPDGHQVAAFCDKPAPDTASRYNAFWTAFGFTDRAAENLLQMMMRSVARESVDFASLGYKVSGFPVAGYVDLGTWPNMRKFQALATQGQ
jgi:hypothetical protein